MSTDVVPKFSLRRRLLAVCRLLGRSDRRMLALAGVLAALAALGAAAQALALRSMIDNVINGRSDAAIGAAIVGAFASGVNGAAGRVYDNLKDWIGANLRVHLSTDTLRTTAFMPGLEHLERPEYLDQVELVNQGSEQVLRSVFSIADLVMLGTRMAVGIWLLATVHPLLAVVPLFAVPSVVLTPHQQGIVDRAAVAAAAPRRASDHIHRLFTQPTPAMEMRVFGALADLDRTSDARWREVARLKLRAAVHASLIAATGWAVLAAGFAGALVFVANEASQGRATAGDIILVAQLALQLRGNIAQTTTSVRMTTDAMRLTDRFLWLGDEAARQAQQYTGTLLAPRAIERGIRLQNISFTYPGSERPTLDDITVDFPAGKTVAIVGDNGAGKTTLIKLLCRFYDPTHGSITIDDTDLAALDVQSWRQHLAGGFQDHLRLETSAFRSVGAGDPPQMDNAERVRVACEQADALEMLEQLPQGIHTHIGQSYRLGAELSGGQWQKVAIGRAMMRSQPLLLLLDEPTAALDPNSEAKLFARYAGAAERTHAAGGVVILISHRFSSVRMADVIVVLEHGRVTEIGAHEQLIARHGAYARMFNRQAAAYT